MSFFLKETYDVLSSYNDCIDIGVCQEVEPCSDVKVQGHCQENALFLSMRSLNVENEAIDTKIGCD